MESGFLPKANILVVDLEATCSTDGSIAGPSMEIIEIGACWISPQGEVLDTFQSFVQPVVNPRLTEFCTSLTCITQCQVNNVPKFGQVALPFRKFVMNHREFQSVWASWGEFDNSQLANDALRHEVENPVGDLPHFNLKKRFAKQRKIKQVGMMTALQIAKIQPTGVHHRALDDAINISKLLNTLR